MSTVRSHARRVHGKTVQVRRHTRTDEEVAAAAQRKRDAFERRVLTERQRAASPGAYDGQARRTSGERRKRRGKGLARAKRHAKKARRLWRRHKVRAAAYAGLTAAELGAWAIGRAGARARKAYRGWKKHRKARGTKR